LAEKPRAPRAFQAVPLLVRQAIHRLEELGLVRVKQGSTTIVLDPAESGDLRVVQLQMELAEPNPRFLAWIVEAQTLSTLALLTLAERRISGEELEQLKRLTDGADDSSPETLRLFREQYWACVARATRNPLYLQQMRWWSAMLGRLERSRPMQNLKDPLFPELYRQLNRTLAEGHGSVELYLKLIKPIHAWIEAIQGIKPRGSAARDVAPRSTRRRSPASS
jgi:DNA-binding FadR family transcriptional regulator